MFVSVSFFSDWLPRGHFFLFKFSASVFGEGGGGVFGPDVFFFVVFCPFFLFVCLPALSRGGVKREKKKASRRVPSVRTRAFLKGGKKEGVEKNGRNYERNAKRAKREEKRRLPWHVSCPLLFFPFFFGWLFEFPVCLFVCVFVCVYIHAYMPTHIYIYVCVCVFYCIRLNHAGKQMKGTPMTRIHFISIRPFFTRRRQRSGEIERRTNQKSKKRREKIKKKVVEEKGQEKGKRLIHFFFFFTAFNCFTV
ncbi:hypothetical protein TCSYLVIO_001275 [Trypanosoma cruzi]|nr:hypothetical protein TCSYLVIO_001275 [Trypanosoma cruzi]